MSVYIYGKSPRDSQFYFRLVDNNNKTILASTEGYQTEQGCLNGIASVKQNSPYDRSYQKFRGNDLKYYFTIKASNGEPIGRSEGYDSEYGRDRGIENCKQEGPRATTRRVDSYSSVS